MAVSENGHKEEKVDEPVEDNGDKPVLESSGSEEAQPQSEGTAEKVTDEQPSVDAEQLSVQKSDDAEEPSNEETQPHSSEDHQQVEDPSAQQDQPTSDNVTITRRVEVPNNKVCFPAHHLHISVVCYSCIWQCVIVGYKTLEQSNCQV